MADEEAVSRERAVSTAWSIHASLADFTGKVDSKASFALTIESAALGGIIALSGAGQLPGRGDGTLPVAALWAGVALLGTAAVLAVLVVMPRTASRDNPQSWRQDYIHYGHLRHWSPEQLAERLTTADPLPVLSRQLVTMSQIAWIKHRRVQQSLYCAVLGTLLVTLAGLIR
ncbi:DUF5706 domain-containing protein [Kitasatospora sp. RB6PN24]|uniref:Pycsar system effector family protein n=1 Tax=Kitasatospora humi TaxID=2893891 RepID=UPI001E31CF1C|nr:Pycsar system effector family protein [Kitasatospora humi]MCC9310940.1 DUF5706 domain-containing protein [Kitasatospora humi]